MKQFIINGSYIYNKRYSDNSLSRHEYIKQNGVESAKIPPHFLFFQTHIYVSENSLYVFIFVYIISVVS